MENLRRYGELFRIPGLREALVKSALIATIGTAAVAGAAKYIQTRLEDQPKTATLSELGGMLVQGTLKADIVHEDISCANDTLVVSNPMRVTLTGDSQPSLVAFEALGNGRFEAERIDPSQCRIDPNYEDPAPVGSTSEVTLRPDKQYDLVVDAYDEHGQMLKNTSGDQLLAAEAFLRPQDRAAGD